MPQPTLTVFVPNYNHANYLPACLNAILSQSLPPREVIVIDDASSDNSIEILNGFAKRHSNLRLFRNEKNQGVLPGLNRAIELSSCSHFISCAADDEVLPGFFEKSMTLLGKYPAAGLCSAASEWRYVDSGLSWQMAFGLADQPTFLTPEELVHLGKAGKLMISSSSVIFRKSALRDVGGFIAELRWHTDWFAAFVSAFRFGMCYVPEPLSVVNILPKSFYTGRKESEQRVVLATLLELLNSPGFSDVRPRVRDSGALCLFAIPMLRIMLSRREFWPFMNLTFLRRTLWRSAELTGKRVLPRWLARAVLKHLYQGRSTPASGVPGK
jgi:glycosyltransferase involved in cell wall biosynthesis